MTPEQLDQWATAHRAHIEVAKAIASVAEYEFDEMARIWRYPTHAEYRSIWERATESGRHNDRAMRWGNSTLAAVGEQFGEAIH